MAPFVEDGITNLAGLANMLSLIHRNLYRGLMCAI